MCLGRLQVAEGDTGSNGGLGDRVGGNTQRRERSSPCPGSGHNRSTRQSLIFRAYVDRTTALARQGPVVIGKSTEFFCVK